MNGNDPLPVAPAQPVGYRRRTIVLGAVVFFLLIATGAAWEFSARRVLFFYGIKTDKILLVRIMLLAGADPTGAPEGLSALDAALQGPEQSLEMVKLLLEFHADPNRPGWSGTPALERVSGPNAPAIFDALLAAGANIKACGPGGTLLEHSWPVAYAEFILSRGADINQVCHEGGPSPLHSHSIVGDPDLVALYLKHGARIVSDGWRRVTPLHEVASLRYDEHNPQHSKYLTSVMLLIAHGADVNAVCFKGMTPLDYAYESGNKEIAEYLLEHGGKALKHTSFEEAKAEIEAAHASDNEYEDLYMFPEGRGGGPRCSLNLVGESRNIMEEGNSWSIIKGTVAVARVNCHASGFFHYAVLGMGPPVPKRLNMPLGGGFPGSEKITFDQKWSHGVMHWYYSPERITDLVKALKKNAAFHFAVRNVTVGD